MSISRNFRDGHSCDFIPKCLTLTTAIVLQLPLTVLARPQTVDSLKSATGPEDTSTAIVRWLFEHFGPIGMVFTLVLAAVIIYFVRRDK